MDEEDKDIDTQELYDALELQKEATEAEIKKAFRRLSLIHHPDRDGGDESKFKEINAAYEVLSNKEKRELYDKYGLEGVKSGGGGMSGFGDIFDIFGRGHDRGRKQKKKVQPTQREIQVSLEDIYTGKMVKLDHNKTILCEDCHGKGGEDVQSCKDCGGKGSVMRTQMIGPNMYTQSQAACTKCKGQGEVNSN